MKASSHAPAAGPPWHGAKCIQSSRRRIPRRPPRPVAGAHLSRRQGRLRPSFPVYVHAAYDHILLCFCCLRPSFALCFLAFFFNSSTIHFNAPGIRMICSYAYGTVQPAPVPIQRVCSRHFHHHQTENKPAYTEKPPQIFVRVPSFLSSYERKTPWFRSVPCTSLGVLITRIFRFDPYCSPCTATLPPVPRVV